jgi:hypothetical protein
MKFTIIFLTIIFFGVSCAILDSSQYFEPIGKTEFSKMKPENSGRIYSSYLESVVHLEKKIIGLNADTIGNFIVKRFDHDHQKSLAFGLGLPFIPAFLFESNALIFDDLIELGLDYYDSCTSFNLLTEKSFCLLANEKDTIKCKPTSFFKSDKDCGLEKLTNSNPKVKCHLSYFFRKNYPSQSVKTLELLPLDKEAKRIIAKLNLKKKNKLYLYYVFGPRL